MPVLKDDMNQKAVGSFTYSATKMDNLGASEYTLVTITQDCSGSVQSYKTDMEKALKEVIHACQIPSNPRNENLMIRLLTFDSHVDEVHGFKLASECKEKDYDGILQPRGMTALFDASENSIHAEVDFGKDLRKNGYVVNGIVFIITDGMNNAGKGTEKTVLHSIEEVRKNEGLESLVTILIGVGVNQDPQAEAALKHFAQESKLDQFISLPDATWKTLAKLAQFISQSISSQSQSVGSGGPSKPVSMTI